jgi:hypothetical protein
VSPGFGRSVRKSPRNCIGSFFIANGNGCVSNHCDGPCPTGNGATGTPLGGA